MRKKGISLSKWEIWGYEQTGTIKINRISKQHKVTSLVRRIRWSLGQYILSAFSLHELEQAIKHRTGKMPNRSVVTRSEAKGYAFGYNKCQQDYKDKWMED